MILTEKQIKYIKKLYKKGYSNGEIAVFFGCSQQQVRYHTDNKTRIYNAILKREKKITQRHIQNLRDKVFK